MEKLAKEEEIAKEDMKSKVESISKIKSQKDELEKESQKAQNELFEIKKASITLSNQKNALFK